MFAKSGTTGSFGPAAPRICSTDLFRSTVWRSEAARIRSGRAKEYSVIGDPHVDSHMSITWIVPFASPSTGLPSCVQPTETTEARSFAALPSCRSETRSALEASQISTPSSKSAMNRVDPREPWNISCFAAPWCVRIDRDTLALRSQRWSDPAVSPVTIQSPFHARQVTAPTTGSVGIRAPYLFGHDGGKPESVPHHDSCHATDPDKKKHTTYRTTLPSTVKCRI
jgi:hypothetical protein